MKMQPSLCVLTACALSGALLIGCEGGISQLTPGVSDSNELVAAYVDPKEPKPGYNPARGGDRDLLPVPDGDAQDREWAVAQPLFVYVSGERGVGGPGFYVELRAIWSDEGNRYAGEQNHIYFLVRWADETFDIFPDYWHYARPSALGLIPSPVPESGLCDSVIVTGANWYVENPNAQEDAVALMFEIEPARDELGTYEEIGCQVACHGGNGRAFGAPPQGKLDLWVWRAGRTNAQESTAYPDLQIVDRETGQPSSRFPLIDTETFWPGYMEDFNLGPAGMFNDPGDPNYRFNKAPYNGLPYTRNAQASPVDGLPIPWYITKYVREIREGTGGTSEPPPEGPPNGNLPIVLYLYGPTAEGFSDCDTAATSRPVGSRYPRWSQNLPAGETDVMPGYLLWYPSGSAADVRAKGDYRELATKRFPVWSVEIRRPLNTGHADDVVLDPSGEFTFTVAVFDRSSQIHSGSGPIRLRFQPSIYATKPGLPGAGRDS